MSALLCAWVRHAGDQRLLELEARVETMQAQAGDSLNFRGSLSSLNHELALWCPSTLHLHATCHGTHTWMFACFFWARREERSKRESSLSIAELTEAQRQLHVQEALAADLNEQLHALHAKHHVPALLPPPPVHCFS